MNMPISEKDYTLHKEYWDYQRKVEYRERIREMANEFEGKLHYSDYGALSEEQIYNVMWNKVEPKYYDDPPEDYVPEDKAYRLWNETLKKRKVKKKDDETDI